LLTTHGAQLRAVPDQTCTGCSCIDMPEHPGSAPGSPGCGWAMRNLKRGALPWAARLSNGQRSTMIIGPASVYINLDMPFNALCMQWKGKKELLQTNGMHWAVRTSRVGMSSTPSITQLACLRECPLETAGILRYMCNPARAFDIYLARWYTGTCLAPRALPAFEHGFTPRALRGSHRWISCPQVCLGAAPSEYRSTRAPKTSVTNLRLCA